MAVSLVYYLPALLGACKKSFDLLKFLFAIRKNASVAELADALDSKSSFFGSVGSTPTGGIQTKAEHLI